MIASAKRKFRASLRFRIFVLLFGLVLTNTVLAATALWNTKKNQIIISEMIDKSISALIAAQGLESELAMQKGFATYFFLNGEARWLQQLQTHRKAFESWLKKARQSAPMDRAVDILNQIESDYIRYIYFKDRVIQLYKEGDRSDGAQLHWEVRQQFDSITALCDKYKRLQEENIARSLALYKKKAFTLTAFSWFVAPSALILGLLLSWILFKQVLGPIRRMALGSKPGNSTRILDEVQALTRRMENLVEDVDLAQSKLQKSRAHLIQAEKLALVGKLAAGVAHSIRNPLTSVKMRLFSLERSLDLDEIQKEDFEVISEEISHLDIIIRNFLEFSRRPKLKVTRVSPSDVVDMTLQLLRHRLESAGVEVHVTRTQHLPEIDADADQLKEALANLILNSCEAMAHGGRIDIVEEEGVIDPMGKVIIIRLTDTGPGIPDTISQDIFNPFFSTKEEGTGLGLSIASRILEEHGGWLHLSPQSEGRGAAFVIGVPCQRLHAWHRS